MVLELKKWKYGLLQIIVIVIMNYLGHPKASSGRDLYPLLGTQVQRWIGTKAQSGRYRTPAAMEESTGAGGGGTDPLQGPKVSSYKGKTCKGCLYFSSVLKSNARSPICVGISRTLPQVPSYIVGESEMEATNDGRSLSDFKYACVGYSVFLDNKDNRSEKGEEQAELPFCAGLELLVDRRASNADNAPAHVHAKEDAGALSNPRPYRPAQAMGEEFMSRFSRNAGLVASGVARNLNRVGNYMKETFDDILYPYRRRPK